MTGPTEASADSFPLIRNPILQFPISVEQREALMRIGFHGTDRWKFLEEGGYFKRRVNSGGFVWYDWYEKKPNGQYGLAGKALRDRDFEKLQHGLIRASRETAGRTTTLSGLPTSGSKTGTLLKTKVQNWTMTAGKNGGVLRGKFLQVMARLGQWRSLSSWGFGGASLALMSFGLGWEVGTVVAQITGLGTENAGFSGGPTVVRVTGWTGPFPAGTLMGTSVPSPGARVTPSAPAFRASLSGSPSITIDADEDQVVASDCYSVLDTKETSPEGSKVMVEVGEPRDPISSGSCKSMVKSAIVVYAPMQIESLTSADGTGDVQHSLPSEPSLPAQMEEAEDVLTDPDFAGIISDAVRAGIEAGDVVWEGDMPPDPNQPTFDLKVPKPYGGESWQSYAARIADLGLDPQPEPALKRQRREDLDPGVVLSVRPAPGSQVGPGDPVKITWNPGETEGEDDPEADPDQSGWKPPRVRDIDFSPISQAMSCNVFPFGIFCWAQETLGGFDGGGTCPTWEIEFSQGTLDLDPCVVEPIMPAIRAMITLSAVVGFVMLVAGFSMGVGRSGGD